MFQASDRLQKTIFGFLLIIPWLVLYQKKLLPHFAETGFDGSLIILIEIIFSLFALSFFKSPQPSRPAYILFGLWLVWNLSAIASIMQSNNIYASAIKQIELVIHSVFTYAVWVTLCTTQKQNKVVYFLIFTFVWLSYYILGEWLIYKEPYFVDWVHQTPFFNNIRHMGFVLIAIYPFLFFPLLKNKNWIATFALSSLYWTLVVWSSSRGLFIASIVATLIIWIAQNKNSRRLSFVILSTFLIGWIAGLSFPSFSHSLNPFRVLFLEPANPSQFFTNNFTSGRWEMWKNTLMASFQNSPFFGFGPDGFKYQSPAIHPNDAIQPHSSLIQAISEYGIINVIVLGAFATYLIKQIVQKVQTEMDFLGTVAVIAFIIGSLVDGHFYYNFSMVFLGIILAISLSRHIDIGYSAITPNIIAILVLFLCFIPLSKHWKTYIEQQNILFSPEQLQTVSSFPSYYFPMNWIYSEYSSPELREEALQLGVEVGPNHCNYLLVKYQADSSIVDSEQFQNSLMRLCRKSDLKKFSQIDAEKLEQYIEH